MLSSDYVCRKCGKIEEVTVTEGSLPETRKCSCGQFMNRIYAANISSREDSPYLSDALGVAPSQVKEATANSEKLGIPTRFVPDGRAEIRNSRHFKEYAKALGFYKPGHGYDHLKTGK